MRRRFYEKGYGRERRGEENIREKGDDKEYGGERCSKMARGRGERKDFSCTFKL